METEGISNKSLEDEFLDEFAIYLEKFRRYPLIAGKIYAYLLICDPEYQSFAQLVARLNVAKSSMSTMLQLLTERKLIEKSKVPGDRKTYYSTRTTAFDEQVLKGFQVLAAARPIIARGLLLLKNKPEKQRKRLMEIDKVYAFVEEELPKIFDDWNKHYEKE